MKIFTSICKKIIFYILLRFRLLRLVDSLTLTSWSQMMAPQSSGDRPRLVLSYIHSANEIPSTPIRGLKQ